jgi:hypothetical protein
MKTIQNLTWKHAWTSVLGCIEGCLKYLKISPGTGWLYGGTGHAFILNIHQDGSCPSGPTAWNTSRFYKLGENLGYKIEGVFGDKRQAENWRDIQKKAWELTKSSLDAGTPVIGWELGIPEFYIVHGYDDIGYYYNGPGVDLGVSPKPWDELANTEIGMLEIYSISPSKRADDQTTIRDALSFVVAFNEGSTEWVLPNYQAGLQGYQVWIDAVSSGRASRMGHAYNTAVWEECRRWGVAFLREAKEKLNGKLSQEFNGAIRSYGDVMVNLKKVTDSYPFFENNTEGEIGKNQKSAQAAEHLRAAESAEKAGLEYLKAIVDGLA